MEPFKYVNTNSYLFGTALFLVCFWIFFSGSGVFMQSFAAAAMAGALGWVSYVLVRWLYLALKK